ncbi:hypothetical protein Hanom_Chr10g00894251 [Helianthus anomalus]
MSLCEGFFRGVGMLQWVDDLRKANEELKGELKASQSVAAELRCQVVEAERKLQEEKVHSLSPPLPLFPSFLQKDPPFLPVASA